MQIKIKQPNRAVAVMFTALVFIFQGSLYGSSPNESLVNQAPVTISGVVTDANTGEALPGVSISIKGTSEGTITDVYGAYSIKVSAGNTLVFSYVGYTAEESIVGTESAKIDMAMVQDIIGLDELVVIGYGVQKKKLNTGANLNVSGDDIESLNTTSSMDALKGLTPGVTITQTSGVPGAENKIYIRGIGTTGNYEPLYIVDGVAVGDIDNLSPSDIESIDILKDAASAAIYGSRAANGVVLVTTRKGKRDAATEVSYSMYLGNQNISKKPDLLNASEYAAVMNEQNINSGFEEFNFENFVPDWELIQSGNWEGTNWFEEMENPDAFVQSHALNITGGSKVSTFSMGASYLEQEGVLGKGVNNTYERINMRMNSEHTLFKIHDRDFVVIGENLTYTNESNPTIRTGSIYWNDLHNMLVASPFLPMWADTITDPSYPFHYSIPWNGDEGNPIASMELESKYNTNNNNAILGNVYLDIRPIKNLSLKSIFGINNWWGSSRHWQPAYTLSNISSNTNDQVDQRMWSGYTWTWTNTATYSFNIQKLHNFTLLAGQEATRNASTLQMDGHNAGSFFNDPEYGYLNNFPELDAVNATLANFGGQDTYGWAMMSYFGRISYDYREKYLLTLVSRWDGSSKFDRGHRWSWFPSVAAGWVISNESFMESLNPMINFMKLRYSLGSNGNQNIQDFTYLSSIDLTGVNYYFGNDRSVTTTGSTPARIPNPNVHWETSVQSNLGLDVNFLSNQVQFSVDWYIKDTKDWLVEPPSSVMDGAAPAPINGGLVRNTGIETMLRYNHNFGDLKMGISGTFAYNRNIMVELPSSDSILHGPPNQLSQGTVEMFRCEAGYPIGYFWGFETDGVMQNDAEVQEWNRQGSAIGDSVYFNPNSLAPGDLRFVDTNEDGVIDDDDKVMIGNPHPDFIFGIQLSLEYKGIFFQLTGNGVAGNQIAKNYRSVDSYRSNYTQEVVDQAWRGEGTSETYPRLIRGSSRNYQWINDTYIYNGDFFRISNLTIGYDLCQALKFLPMQEFRVYGTARNLFTFTRYPGMDPEVGYSPTDDNNPSSVYNAPWGSGIDLGLYPPSRIFMIGANITF